MEDLHRLIIVQSKICFSGLLLIMLAADDIAKNPGVTN